MRGRLIRTGWVAASTTFVLAVSAAGALPSEIVVHWSLAGEPDRVGGKGMLFLFGIMPALVWAFVTRLDRIGGIAADDHDVTLASALPFLFIPTFVVAAITLFNLWGGGSAGWLPIVASLILVAWYARVLLLARRYRRSGSDAERARSLYRRSAGAAQALSCVAVALALYFWIAV